MTYSKRCLHGLKTPKEKVVRSLSDYMKLFANDKLKDYIYRGENTNYHETISSALRDGEYPFLKMKEDFKREVNHMLAPEERFHFLAFAQHHGIPTNLVDFTRSPLVALYFACQPFHGNNNDFDEQRGFVYLIKDEFIDITDIVARNEDKNILLLLINNENNIIMEFYVKFLDYYHHYPQKFYEYFKCLYLDSQDFLTFEKKAKKRFPKYDEGNYESYLDYEYVQKNKKLVKDIEKTFKTVELSVLEYILMLQDVLGKIIEYTEPLWWLNFMPNFIYTPILSFTRGRNQQGMFIYQAYLSFDEDVYHTHVISQQRVWPDMTIVIENKERILEELDFMGINEKFIYGDYDSIARYIKRKYYPKKIGF